MKEPVIKKECVKPLLDTKFIKVADLQYREGCHYFDATRHSFDNLTATKTDEEFMSMPADAVTCIVILKTPKENPRLLLSYEYRYPAGQFLLSPCAGLIDVEDLKAREPALAAAEREIFEETGLRLRLGVSCENCAEGCCSPSEDTSCGIGSGADLDRLFLVNPLLFSSPGMTDESNAIACAVVQRENLSELTQEGAEGSECFNGFELLTEARALEILKKGRDDRGRFYSAYTFIALMYFVSGLWK